MRITFVSLFSFSCFVFVIVLLLMGRAGVLDRYLELIATSYLLGMLAALVELRLASIERMIVDGQAPPNFSDEALEADSSGKFELGL